MSVKSLKTGTRTFSMLAGNTPEHHVLLAESTVGSGGAASVTFSDIPQTYQHLQIRIIARGTYPNPGTDFISLRINSDATASNYRTHRLIGDGASATSDSQSGVAHLYIERISIAGSTANVFGAIITDILDYTSTSKNKTARSLGGVDLNGSGLINFNSGVWMQTSAITSMTLSPGYNNFAQYSTFQLYGVK